MLIFYCVLKPSILNKTPRNIQYKEFLVLLERFKQVQILQKLGMELTGSVLNEKEIMKIVRKSLLEAFGFSGVRLYKYDQEKNLLKSVFSFGLRPTRFNTWKNPTDEKEYVLKRALGIFPIKKGEHKNICYIQDRSKSTFADKNMIKNDISYYGEESKIKENIYYVLFSKHKEIIGLIMINNWLSGKPLFNEKNKNEILETLNIFINHTALALENHNIYNKLLETQKELILLEKNKILAEAAFTLSHEIRNPLHAISGFTQIMRKNTYPAEKQKDFFNQIMEASDRINHVVEKFTNFSSILSTPPKFVFISLNKIIEKAVEKEQEWLCGIKLNLKLEDSPATYLDNNKLSKAFQEIIRNACKSMEEADKKVLEIKSKINKNNNTIKIDFKDSGKGIDKKHMNKIFDPLFTMTDYRKSETPGLGLSMARIVIETYHHGHIEVKSLKNSGAIISVTIPILSKVSKFHQDFLINVLPHL